MTERTKPSWRYPAQPPTRYGVGYKKLLSETMDGSQVERFAASSNSPAPRISRGYFSGARERIACKLIRRICGKLCPLSLGDGQSCCNCEGIAQKSSRRMRFAADSTMKKSGVYQPKCWTPLQSAITIDLKATKSASSIVPGWEVFGLIPFESAARRGSAGFMFV